jgi:hypothetical protein
LTPLPISLATNQRWKTTKSTTTGPASTTAPASIAPKGLAVELATLLM